MADPIVGIDLGTTNSVVAACDANGNPRVLADAAGVKIHPSVVSFHPNGSVIVGVEGKQRRIIDPRNTVYSAKRLIGRPFRSREIQAAQSRMPYLLKEGQNQQPVIITRGGEFAVPEISAIILDHVRNVAATALGEEVTRAVVTVPASFNDAQRSATATAGAIAGITVARVLNEPTAAALAYGHQRQLSRMIAVYDFGGGTFDVTVLRLQDQVYEVLGTAGDTFLGGDDIDEALMQHMADAFLTRHRIDLRDNEIAVMRLRAVAEQTKIELSRRTRAIVKVDEAAYGPGGVPINLEIEIHRDELVGKARPIIERSFTVCEEALRLAGVTPGQIDDIVLVGGTTKIPAVRERVTQFFQRAPRSDVNPEEAVALGAALQAAALDRVLSKRVTGRTTLMPPPAPAPVTARAGAAPPPPAAAPTKIGMPAVEPTVVGPPPEMPPVRTTSPLGAAPVRPPGSAVMPIAGPVTAKGFDAPTSVGPPPTPPSSLPSLPAIPPLKPRSVPAIPPIPPAPARGPAAKTMLGIPTVTPTESPPPPPPEEVTAVRRPGTQPRLVPDSDLAIDAMLDALEGPTKPGRDAPADAAREPEPEAEPTAGAAFVPAAPVGEPMVPAVAEDMLPSMEPVSGPPRDLAIGGLSGPLVPPYTPAPAPSTSTGPLVPPYTPAASSTGPLVPPFAPAPAPAPFDPFAPEAQPTTQFGQLETPVPPTSPADLGMPRFTPRAPAEPPPPVDPRMPMPRAPSEPPAPRARASAPTSQPTALDGLFEPPEARGRRAPSEGREVPLPPERHASPTARTMFDLPAPPAPVPAPAPPAPAATPTLIAGLAAQPVAVAVASPPPTLPVVLDVTPRSLGIGTVAGYCEEIIRRNARVPTETRRMFTTSRDQQQLVRIRVCTGESRRIDDNLVLGDLVLEGLPARPRGQTRIEVTFALDASGILNVRARDAQTGQEQRATLDVLGAQSQAEVDAARERFGQIRPQTAR